MIDYYDLIIGTDDYTFLSIFNKLWDKEIEFQNLPYTNAIQIKTGNRLRPILMAWGYYAGCNHENNSYIANYAISIELLHKASILLDDIIDDDIARHGYETFHIQYSKSEAILYAIYILNRSITIIYEKDNYKKLFTPALLKVIDNMVRGGIKELSSENNFFTLEDVKEIIELETVSLIENSFVLGYQLSTSNVSDTPEAVTNIGRSCGYCFQVLNDIEPFSAPSINQAYKGTLNYDFEKNRKNIVISFLYGCCTQNERMQITNIHNFKYICKLVEKYDVISTLLTELELEIHKIMKQTLYFKNQNINFYIDFKKFLINIFNICYKKCGLFLKEDLFND